MGSGARTATIRTSCPAASSLSLRCRSEAVLPVDISSFDVHWKITGIGSASLTWIADHETLELRTTYVGHGLQSLLRRSLRRA
jgi:hypothetical protein